MGDITGDGAADPDPLDGLELNEEFVRGAAQKEASARARMLGAQWRDAPPVDPGGRRWSLPEQQAPRQQKRWRVPRLVAVLLASALAIGALALSGLLGRLPRHAPTAGGTAPSASGADVPSLAAPFAGSPAASWSDNADGIVLPPAKPVGNLSAATVGQDLAEARLYLVVAYLNPQILGGGSAQPVLDMLASEPRRLLAGALVRPSRYDDPVMWLSRFNPAKVRPVGQVVKVRGTLTASPDGTGGMTVHADVDFVYAARQAPNGSAVVRVVARRVLDFVFHGPAHSVVDTAHLYVSPTNGYTANDSCALIDGYLNPAFPTTPGDGLGSGPAVDPYDTAQPLPSPGQSAGRCQNVRQP
ncbi:hypothetical protein [Streptacidiphilus jiangxiensis]|uniref:Uncharacterized protein n=1 Tax=Streptacidiphilus jiangxiensis TaxID=235985 RepID=A0A1H7Q4E9_STRJI|nr:hypothetical protein [Streptacidiphilus jiangxiensis]SEL42177.1 hypothetical protein SAMN05414137_108252 [Streptacidiphilus jiangxiensis]